jgi:hypothetical protein
MADPHSFPSDRTVVGWLTPSYSMNIVPFEDDFGQPSYQTSIQEPLFASTNASLIPFDFSDEADLDFGQQGVTIDMAAHTSKSTPSPASMNERDNGFTLEPLQNGAQYTTIQVQQMPPLAPLARQQSGNTEASSSSSSKSFVITTPPSEKELVYESSPSPTSQEISKAPPDSMKTPCRFKWTLPKRVSLYVVPMVFLLTSRLSVGRRRAIRLRVIEQSRRPLVPESMVRKRDLLSRMTK